ncbi:MAG: hypothetical protein ACPG19_07060, partial [Saprospiraceae bacterium]
MKKYNILIILGLIFGLSISQSFAQKGGPGLYGKKLFVEFGMSTSASVQLPRYNENNKDGYRLDDVVGDGIEVPLTFNFNYQLSAHYALDRLRTAGLGLSYSRTGFTSPDASINANISSTNLNFFIRQYYLSSGSIAPVGRYAQYGISAMFNNRSFSQSSLVYEDPEKLTSQTYVSPAVNLEFGRETVINDILLYSFAFQSSFALPYGMDEESKYAWLQSEIPDTMFGRLLSYYSFRFKFA